jgi:hypothetical protein
MAELSGLTEYEWFFFVYRQLAGLLSIALTNPSISACNSLISCAVPPAQCVLFSFVKLGGFT